MISEVVNFLDIIPYSYTAQIILPPSTQRQDPSGHAKFDWKFEAIVGEPIDQILY